MINYLAKKIWKQTYGYDAVAMTRGEGSAADSTPRFKFCLKAEFSKFAKKCRKQGGVFKCCANS